MGDRTAPSRPGAWWLRALVKAVPVVLLLAAVVAGALYLNRHESERVVDGGASGPPVPPPEVSVVTIAPEDVPFRPTYIGRASASQVVEIRARVNGFLEERAFEEGSRVEAGQLLFRIDPKPLEAQRDVVEARLAAARTRLELTQRELARIEAAAERGAVSPTELDERRTAVLVAQADVALEEAQLTEAQLNLGYTSIKSPIDGVIGRSLKDVGSYLQTGTDGLLAVVQQIDPMYIDFAVSEGDILRWQRLVETGAVRAPENDSLPLAIELADGRRYPIEGQLKFVDVQVDPTTGAAMARGQVPNPDQALRPGQFVRVTVLGIERLGALLVPQEAVMQAPTGASVYVVNDSNVAEIRQVQLGPWVEDRWLIESGLEPGERVIVDGLMKVRAGEPVTVVAAPSAPSPDGNR